MVFAFSRADASAGIVMRSSKDGAYLMGIRGDGTIFIKSQNGKDEKILAEKKTELKGKINLKAQAFGSVLYLEANGERVFAKDAFNAYGKCGLFAQNADAKFSNFAISNPAKRIRAINTTVKFFVIRNENKMWPCILDCNPKEMGDCHWELEKGLADPNGVSLRSMSYPNKYLAVHDDGKVYLKEYENTPEFKKSATWYQRKGNHEGLHSSFESMARPGEFMKHIGWRLSSYPVKTGGEKYDSTFELIE